MSLKGHTSVVEVDGPTLIVIDFCVAALTQRTDSTEASLQLSENIILFAVSCDYAGMEEIS
jgi:hypothetical protein